MDDPDVLAMLADLGNGRREEYSAPEERREERMSRREEEEIRQQADARRANAHRAARNDVEKDRIQKWNTPETFGVDEVAEQLLNRFSGQGHRAAISGGRGNRDPDFDAREGRQTRRGPPPAGRFQEPPRAPALTQRDPNRQRAPSPRAAGTKKWPGANKNAVAPNANASNGAPIPVRPAAAAAPPPTNPPARANAPPAAPHIAAPRQGAFAAPAVHAAVAPAPAPSRLRSMFDLLNRVATSAAAPAVRQPTPASSKPTEKQNGPAPTTVSIKLTDPRRKIRALFDAADLCNTDIGDAYLQEARRRLAQDAVLLVQKADTDEIEVYLSRHKERSWMIEAAVKARAQPEATFDHPGLEAIYEETRNALLREAPAPATPVPAVVAEPAPSQADSHGTAQEKDEIEEKGYMSITFVDERGNYVGFQRLPLPIPIQSSMNMVAPNGVPEPMALARALETLASEFK